MKEVTFEVTEADEGGYCAAGIGVGIHTQAETLEDLQAQVRDAVACYFDDPDAALHVAWHSEKCR